MPRKSAIPKKSISKKSSKVVTYRRIRGNGAYKVANAIPEVSAEDRKKNRFGTNFGGRLGAWLGNKAHQLFRHITGMGAYKIKGNTMIHGEQPAMFEKRENGHRIQHREFVQDVVSTTSAYTCSTLDVSISNQAVFPWLANLSNAYEQYRVLGAVWEYVPLSGSVSSNQSLGYVSLATEMDSNKPQPISKLQLENFDWSVQSVPCENMLHPIECDPAQTSIPVLYVAPNGNPLPTENKNFVSFCNTYLSVGGQSASGQVLGSLYLAYDIELLKPRLQVSVPSQCELHYRGVGPSNAIPFGASAPTLRTASAIQSFWLRDSQVTITSNKISLTGLPVGTQVLFTYYATGALITTGQFTVAPVGAVTENDFYGGSYLMQAPQTGVASVGNMMFGCAFSTTAADSNFTFAATGAVPGTAYDLIISVMNAPDA
nr:putative capsid protein [Crucivirus sp.]